jgi:hypothetical protein
MRPWSDSIDPSTIPDAVLLSERARRNSGRRQTHGAGTGRPRIPRPCPRCGAIQPSATAARRHCR